jgi:hypothetical protein
MVREEMAKLPAEKQKALQVTSVQLMQRFSQQPQPSQQTPPQVTTARQPAPPQQPPQPALNANNLQKHSEQLAEQRMSQLAHKNRMSPDGNPPIVIKAPFSAADLKLPPKKPKRKAEHTPEETTPNKLRSPRSSQATPKAEVSSPALKNRPQPTVEKTFKCERSDCDKAFALKGELADHLKMHEREAEKRREEEGRAKFRIDNPLEFTLASVAGGLGLNRDGTPKDSKVKAEPDTKPAPAEEEGVQLLTPPATFWDLPGSPMALHQCFEGLDSVSPLASLDISLFVPPTPEDISAEELNVAALADTYDSWNPFGMKDACGTEMLQEISWDNDAPLFLTKDGRNWGETNGLMMFVH